MKYVVRVKEIEEWIKTRRDMWSSWGYDPDDPETTMPDLLTAQTRRLSGWLGENDMFRWPSHGDDKDPVMPDHAIIGWDTDRFPIIHAMCAAIKEEHDADPRWGADRSVWRKFGLQGDDDVDYNGSYLFDVLEILWLYSLDNPEKQWGKALPAGADNVRL